MPRQSRPTFAGDSPGTSVTLGGNRRVAAEAHGGTGQISVEDALRVIATTDLDLLRRSSTGSAMEGVSFEQLLLEELTADGDILIRNGGSVERLAGPAATQLRTPLLYGSEESPRIHWADRWATPRQRRRQMELYAAGNQATLAINGWPGLVTTSGVNALTMDRNSMAFRRYESAASTGAFAGVESAFDLFRWNWNPTVSMHFRTQNVNLSTFWAAATDTSLDGVTAPATQKMAGLSANPAVDNNWHCWTTDGAIAQDTDTGIGVLGAKVYLFWMEFDDAASTVRFYLYNWTDDVYSGLIATHSTRYPGVSGSDAFGLGQTIEATSATARETDFGRWLVECDG